MALCVDLDCKSVAHACVVPYWTCKGRSYVGHVEDHQSRLSYTPKGLIKLQLELLVITYITQFDLINNQNETPRMATQHTFIQSNPYNTGNHKKHYSSHSWPCPLSISDGQLPRFLWKQTQKKKTEITKQFLDSHSNSLIS